MSDTVLVLENEPEAPASADARSVVADPPGLDDRSTDVSVVPALELSPDIARFPIAIRGRRRLFYRFAKRSLDLLVLAIAGPVALAIVAVVALINKIEDPSAPIFHIQDRTGAGGRRFRLYKVRTMVANAEELKASLTHLNTRTWPDFKVDDDPRITGIGRILRTTSLDELPQLWNILRGDMTLVGPRPTTLGPEAYQSWQTERFEVRPGLTGLWQLAGRDSPSFVERARLDIGYVRRRSLRLDVYILLRTIPAVLGGRGE